MAKNAEGSAVPPERRIDGFHRDGEGQWVAEAAREDALLRGLCEDGADEVARDTLRGPLSPGAPDRPGPATGPPPRRTATG